MPIETGCVTKRRCDSRTPYESKIRLLTMSLSFAAFASVVGRTVTDSDRLKAALWRNFLRFLNINASNYDPSFAIRAVIAKEADCVGWLGGWGK
jgi:hypothetical protein